MLYTAHVSVSWYEQVTVGQALQLLASPSDQPLLAVLMGADLVCLASRCNSLQGLLDKVEDAVDRPLPEADSLLGSSDFRTVLLSDVAAALDELVAIDNDQQANQASARALVPAGTGATGTCCMQQLAQALRNAIPVCVRACAGRTAQKLLIGWDEVQALARPLLPLPDDTSAPGQHQRPRAGRPSVADMLELVEALRCASGINMAGYGTGM